MRTATPTHSPASATRAGITARVAAHHYREPRVREIPRRGVELGHRAAAGNRVAHAA